MSGTPPTGTTSFSYSVTASNGVSPDATAGPFTVTVSAATGNLSASIDLDARSHDVYPGDTVTLHVTVSGQRHKPKPSGSVSFTDDGAAVSGCTGLALSSSGQARCQVSYATTAGSPHDLVVSYSGDGAYEPATAATKITVMKIRTRLRLVASKDPVVDGQQVVVSVTVIAEPRPGEPAAHWHREVQR